VWSGLGLLPPFWRRAAAQAIGLRYDNARPARPHPQRSWRSSPRRPAFTRIAGWQQSVSDVTIKPARELCSKIAFSSSM